jgi:molybdopterin-guanine dinucleotide biosynthesis protein A
VYRRKAMLLQSEEVLKSGLSSPLDAIHRLGRPFFVSIEEEINRIDPQLRTFFNVNTRQDLAKAEELFAEMNRSC